MDHSCNSGSLQSSSGCEEDYVSSKPNSLSNFFNSCIQPPPPPPPPPSSSLFHSLPNYLDSSFPSPTFTDHHHHHHHHHMNLINTSSTKSTTTPTASSSSSLQHSTGISSSSRPKTSKKRTRASRRAPTTVLTTDTTNFRAMVQEFTGIPTASFMPYNSLPAPPRFDLLPPYLLRPFAQKVAHLPPPPSSVDVIGSSLPSIHSSSHANTSATATCSNINTAAATTSTSLGLNMQSQNPILSFQSMQDHHHHHQHANLSAQLSSKVPLDFDWHKGAQTHDHQSEERGASTGIDSWVLSSD